MLISILCDPGRGRTSPLSGGPSCWTQHCPATASGAHDVAGSCPVRRRGYTLAYGSHPFEQFGLTSGAFSAPFQCLLDRLYLGSFKKSVVGDVLLPLCYSANIQQKTNTAVMKGCKPTNIHGLNCPGLTTTQQRRQDNGRIHVHLRLDGEITT